MCTHSDESYDDANAPYDVKQQQHRITMKVLRAFSYSGTLAGTVHNRLPLTLFGLPSGMDTTVLVKQRYIMFNIINYQ